MNVSSRSIKDSFDSSTLHSAAVSVQRWAQSGLGVSSERL